MRPSSALTRPLFLLSLALSACGRGEDGDRDSTAAATSPLSEETPAEARQEAERLLGPDGSRYRAAWDNQSIAKGWSSAVLRKLRQKISVFESARDLEDFCPGYFGASRPQRETCWLRITSAMARYESEFGPRRTYREHTGGLSVGLLMMNPEHCPSANTEEALKEPIANLDCAMDRMARLISRDRYLSGPISERGAAAYWSVLRPPYRFRQLQLGKKAHIQQFTRSYLAYGA